MVLQGKGSLTKLKVSPSKYQFSEALEGTCASLKYLVQAAAATVHRSGRHYSSPTDRPNHRLSFSSSPNGPQSLREVWDVVLKQLGFIYQILVCPHWKENQPYFSSSAQQTEQLTSGAERNRWRIPEQKPPKVTGRTVCKLSFYGKRSIKSLSKHTVFLLNDVGINKWFVLGCFFFYIINFW